MRRVTIILLTLCLTGQTEVYAQGITEDPLAIQARCLGYRDRVTQDGFLAIESRSEEGIGGPTSEKHGTQFRFWFSPENLRVDVRGLDSNGKWGEWEYYVVKEDSYIWVPEGQFEGLVAPASEYEDARGGVMGHFVLYHPRWIGMGENHESAMQRYPGARLVNPHATKAKFTVMHDVLDDHDAVVLKCPTSFPGPNAEDARNPGEIRLWFAPQAGWSLLHGEVREIAPKATIVRSVHSTIQQVPNEGFWFPSRVVRETSYDGRVTTRTEMVVTEARLGKPVDPAVFTVAGMNLPKGKRIADRTKGSRETVAISDGDRMISLDGPNVSMAPPPQRSGWGGWLLAVNAILFTILGGFAVYRAFR